jgi:hypothetical protein
MRSAPPNAKMIRAKGLDTSMRDINVIAKELSEVKIEADYIKSGALKELEDEEEALRVELLSALKEARLKSVKVEDGPVFSRSERVNYVVANLEDAIKWAKKNKCISVDKSAANKILRTKYPDMPKGFEVKITEFISVRGNNDEQAENNQ